jgi:phosphosulfolactate synthase
MSYATDLDCNAAVKKGGVNMKSNVTPEDAATILGAVSTGLGRSGVIDLGIGPAHCADFVDLVRPVLTEWKVAVTFWLICDRQAVQRKINTLKEAGATVIAGGTAGEIAAHRGQWDRYIGLCQSLGFDRVELAEGFLGTIENPKTLVRRATDAGLEVQYEVGLKDIEADRAISVESRMEIAETWADAGAQYMVIEAREVGAGYAMFSTKGEVNAQLAEALIDRFSLDKVIFETPTRPMYTAILNHLGPGAHLGNIYPEELLRVEAMRRAIHADTIAHQAEWSGSHAGAVR